MNIFEIQNNLLSIFDEIEENGGELTPDLEKQLFITQETFKDKVEAYSNVIKLLDKDLSLIKEEENRLESLYKKKENTINKLKEILVNAISNFGDTKKSGVKYIDYGTGEVSIRKTKAVELNTDLISYINSSLDNVVTFTKQCNQLDACDKIDLSDIIKDIEYNTNVKLTENELDKFNVNFEVKVPIKELSNGNAYPILKEIAKYTDKYNLLADVSKSEIKPLLEENGSCMPNIAKLKENKSISIK